MARYAVPVESYDGLSSKVREHFGKSEFFAILEVEHERIVSVTCLEKGPSEDRKSAAYLLVDSGVNVVLAASIGPCMRGTLMDRGVRLFTDAEGTVENAFNDLIAGKLKEKLATGCI
jgi:predicted Fe-Mo cluster-binding NifX family protein